MLLATLQRGRLAKRVVLPDLGQFPKSVTALESHATLTLPDHGSGETGCPHGRIQKRNVLERQEVLECKNVRNVKRVGVCLCWCLLVLVFARVGVCSCRCLLVLVFARIDVCLCRSLPVGGSSCI